MGHECRLEGDAVGVSGLVVVLRDGVDAVVGVDAGVEDGRDGVLGYVAGTGVEGLEERAGGEREV